MKKRTIELYNDIRRTLSKHIEANFKDMSEEEYFDVLELDSKLSRKVDQLKLQIQMDDVNSVDHKALERRIKRQ